LAGNGAVVDNTGYCLAGWVGIEWVVSHVENQELGARPVRNQGVYVAVGLELGGEQRGTPEMIGESIDIAGFGGDRNLADV